MLVAVEHLVGICTHRKWNSSKQIIISMVSIHTNPHRDCLFLLSIKNSSTSFMCWAPWLFAIVSVENWNYTKYELLYVMCVFFNFPLIECQPFFFCYIDASHSHIWNYYYPIYCWMLFNPNRVLANWKPKNSMLFIKYFIWKLYRIRGLQRGFFLYRVLWILTMHVVVVVWYLPILIHHSGFYIQ